MLITTQQLFPVEHYLWLPNTLLFHSSWCNDSSASLRQYGFRPVQTDFCNRKYRLCDAILLKPVPSKHGLSNGAKIGIGVGAGIITIVFGIMMFLLLWKHKQHKKDRKALEEMSGLAARDKVSRRAVHLAVSRIGGRMFHQRLAAASNLCKNPPYPKLGLLRRYMLRIGDQVNSALFLHYNTQTTTQDHLYLARIYRRLIRKWGGDNGYANRNRSELNSGDYGVQRQELQCGYQEWRHESIAQPVVYHEAPAGRMTPMMPPQLIPGMPGHSIGRGSTILLYELW